MSTSLTPSVHRLTGSSSLERLFGTKCEGCGRSFGTEDLVMRAKNKIYHLECFRCIACDKKLVPGDEFALRQDGLFCKEDHQVDMVVHQPTQPPDGSKIKDLENNNNNTTSLMHNTSNSSEDNSEGTESLYTFICQKLCIFPEKEFHFARLLL